MILGIHSCKNKSSEIFFATDSTLAQKCKNHCTIEYKKVRYGYAGKNWQFSEHT